MIEQEPLSPEYTSLEIEALEDRIARRKDELAGRLCILGHHYQTDEVIQFADFVGDSLKLSQQSARTDAEYIVFCGVHFMAETAEVLSSDKQAVILPNLLAGCSMSDMADESAVKSAVEELSEMTDARIVPITYVNSSVSIKAATARNGGACCTSSNVQNVFTWALRPTNEGGAGGDKVLCIPDQHLGRNTAVAMGYSLQDCALYDPDLPNGGLKVENVERARFILWKGHCYVHSLFTPEQVYDVRKQHPGIQVIVHPECPHEVVRLADAAGSTEQIIAAVNDAKAGSMWAIGTESSLVNRLAVRHKDRFVQTLSDAPATCSQMKRIDLPHLAWVLDNLAEGRIVNRISVPADIGDDARVAMKRMIGIKASVGLTGSRLGEEK
ncbi:MAG: quinolinate synthase NadA [Phycisphaerae bacterium]|nr:quinolinate synthase NadA [Phycisphaerae bacterium]